MTEQQFKEITEWQKQTFPGATELSKLHHLKDEIKELMSDVENEQSEARFEYADCFFLLYGAAAIGGFTYQDIIDSIQEKFEINKARKWGKPDENGVVNHIKNEPVYPNEKVIGIKFEDRKQEEL